MQEEGGRLFGLEDGAALTTVSSDAPPVAARPEARRDEADLTLTLSFEDEAQREELARQLGTDIRRGADVWVTTWPLRTEDRLFDPREP